MLSDLCQYWNSVSVVMMGGRLCPNSYLLGLLIVVFWFLVEIRTGGGGGGGDSEFF